MQTSDKPSLIPVPFANSGTKNTIPTDPPATPGSASLETGFPPITMTPVAAGGIPPQGADFNGIFNLISAASRWAQAGGGYTYDADFATAIGGYPKGAILSNAAGTGLWMSTVDSNTANPDTGGANWIDPLAGRLLNIQVFDTAGSFTYTPTPGATWAIGDVQAAGGQGGGSPAAGSNLIGFGTGGHSGARVVGKFSLSGVTTLPITIGAGGSTGSAGAPGQSGGSTSIGALMTASGGPGGTSLGPTPGPSLFGNPASLPSVSVDPSVDVLFQQRGNAGATAIIISGGAGVAGSGGTSPGYSGSVVGAVGTSGGAPGVQPGQGGSGAFTAAGGAAQVGGVGFRGRILLWEYS